MSNKSVTGNVFHPSSRPFFIIKTQTTHTHYTLIFFLSSAHISGHKWLSNYGVITIVFDKKIIIKKK